MEGTELVRFVHKVMSKRWLVLDQVVVAVAEKAAWLEDGQMWYSMGFLVLDLGGVLSIGAEYFEDSQDVDQNLVQIDVILVEQVAST